LPEGHYVSRILVIRNFFFHTEVNHSGLSWKGFLNPLYQRATPSAVFPQEGKCFFGRGNRWKDSTAPGLCSPRCCQLKTGVAEGLQVAVYSAIPFSL
jgi:hypothetical protein